MPRLEALEGRALLSTTFTVKNLADSGNGSLRQAILDANANPNADVIDFAPKLHGTITLTGLELAITKNLDIEGPGANKLTISGDNASRVFEIGNGATVTLANLTIANGQTTSDYTLSEDLVPSSDELGGGGILNNAGAKLNLTSCAVVNNQAKAGHKLDVFGGGLLNLGTTTVTSCTFTGNQALDGSASDFFGGSAGGAIDNFGTGTVGHGATLTVTGSTFTNNQAISTKQEGLFF